MLVLNTQSVKELKIHRAGHDFMGPVFRIATWSSTHNYLSDSHPAASHPPLLIWTWPVVCKAPHHLKAHYREMGEGHKNLDPSAHLVCPPPLRRFYVCPCR